MIASLRTLARAGTQATRSASSGSPLTTSSAPNSSLAQLNSFRPFSRSAVALDGTTQDPSQLKPENASSVEDTEANSELLQSNYGQADVHKESEPKRNEAEDDKAAGKGKGGKDVEDLSIANGKGPKK